MGPDLKSLLLDALSALSPEDAVSLGTAPEAS